MIRPEHNLVSQVIPLINPDSANFLRQRLALELEKENGDSATIYRLSHLLNEALNGPRAQKRKAL